MAIQFVDLDIIPEKTQVQIKNILNKEHDSIKQELAGLQNLRVHFKAHDVDGTKKKYSIHLFLDIIGKSITIGDTDWDPIIALNKCIDTLKNKLEKEKGRKQDDKIKTNYNKKKV